MEASEINVNNSILTLVEVVLVLLQPVVRMIAMLLEFRHSNLNVIHISIQWRDMLHTIWEQLQPLIQYFEIMDALSDILILACWLLDLAIVPQWIRDTFAQCFENTRTVGRPRRFKRYAPIIRVMIEKFDYTNARVRRVFQALGVGTFYLIYCQCFHFTMLDVVSCVYRYNKSSIENVDEK